MSSNGINEKQEESMMGPTESTLRWAANTSNAPEVLHWRTAYDISLEAYRFLHGSAESLGMPDLPVGPDILDVYSEAIECAEALGI